MKKNISLALLLTAAVVTQSSQAVSFFRAKPVVAVSPAQSAWNYCSNLFAGKAATKTQKGFANVTKNFVTSHKKAIAITTAAVAVVAAGYKYNQEKIDTAIAQGYAKVVQFIAAQKAKFQGATQKSVAQKKS